MRAIFLARIRIAYIPAIILILIELRAIRFRLIASGRK
jgi:hypothetical protein